MANSETATESGIPQFSAAAQDELKAIFALYPDRQSATLPVLHLAQREFGFISPAVEELVAKVLKRPVTEVHGVVTFHTMFNTHAVGKYHIQICRNISCWLCNSPGLLSHLKNRLGIDVGQTTPDGKFTLSQVECLGHCEFAPALQINDEIVGNLTAEKIDHLIDEAK